jgi:transposase
VFVIGVDPHKGSHTAAVLNTTEEVIAEYGLDADPKQLGRLLEWAAPFVPRGWALEGASGTGALLAPQLVAAGEYVVDVPPTLSARVRLLDRGRSDKTDAHDARAAAVVALRHANLRTVTVEDHDAVLRLLADRHHDLIAQRTRIVCRLHALLAQLREGGAPQGLSADRAGAFLARMCPVGAADLERKRLCGELLDEIRHLDKMLADLRRRTVAAVAASATTVTDVYGVGPTCAAILVGHTSGVGASPARATSHASTAALPSTHPAGRSNATASTPAGTANSTTRCTSPRSPKWPTTPRDGPTTSARFPKDNPAKKPYERSSDGSATLYTGG